MNTQVSTAVIDRLFTPLARLAERQKGLATRQQLIDIGYSTGAIDRAVDKGAIWAVHRGIYAVGHWQLPRHGWELAAVLACGPERTLVSGYSAAMMWGIFTDPYREYHHSFDESGHGRRRVDVLVIGGQPSRHGVDARRVDNLHDCDRSTIEGIPVTSPYRTLLDMARGSDLQTALNNARAKGLVDNEGLKAVMKRYPRRQGIGSFRQAIGIEDFSRSAAEDLLFEVLMEHEVPLPRRNHFVGSREVDFVWHSARVVVEVDGFQFHDTYQRFENDHDRDIELGLEGYTVLRFTWRQIKNESKRIGELVHRSLAEGYERRIREEERAAREAREAR